VSHERPARGAAGAWLRRSCLKPGGASPRPPVRVPSSGYVHRFACVSPGILVLPEGRGGPTLWHTCSKRCSRPTLRAACLGGLDRLLFRSGGTVSVGLIQPSTVSVRQDHLNTISGRRACPADPLRMYPLAPDYSRCDSDADADLAYRLADRGVNLRGLDPGDWARVSTY
jgi:hypothetical protein